MWPWQINNNLPRALYREILSTERDFTLPVSYAVIFTHFCVMHLTACRHVIL